MKGNAWLAVFAVFSLAAIGGAGFYCFKEYSRYAESFGGWDDLAGRISMLQAEKPTPTEDNVKRFDAELSSYQAKVDSLYQSLDQFQKPLNTQLNQTQFQAILTGKIDAFKKMAAEKKITIPESFFFGFDDYQSEMPKQEITPLLNYQLDGIEHLSKHLLEVGIQELANLERAPLPGEQLPNQTGTDPPTPVATSVVQKYPVNFRFEGTHRAFQDFVNRIANDDEYFFILRVLRVENSEPTPPAQGAVRQVVSYIDEDLNPIPEEVVETKLAGLSPAEIPAAAQEFGWIAKPQDAVILFGQETVKVFAAIEIVRFLSPEEVEVPAEAPDSSSRRDRRPGKS